MRILITEAVARKALNIDYFIEGLPKKEKLQIVSKLTGVDADIIKTISVNNQHKGRKIITSVGEIPFYGKSYLLIFKKGYTINGVKTLSVNLTGDMMGLLKETGYSKALIKKIVFLILTNTYQATADIISRDLGMPISKQVIWTLMMNYVAPRIEQYERDRTIDHLKKSDSIEALYKEESEAERVKTLFFEFDGYYVSLDNVKEESKKNGHKQELKFGKAYIGWAKRYDEEESEQYKTVGTKYVASFDDSKTFKAIFEGRVAEVYDLLHVKQIILNGDGEKWIFNNYSQDHRVIMQLDLFHIFQRIKNLVPRGAIQTELKDLVRQKKFGTILTRLEEIKEEATSHEQRMNYDKLNIYFTQNFTMLNRYQDAVVVEVEEGLEARTLGTMEGSVGNVLARRLKDVAWSQDGAAFVARLLCLYKEGHLEQILDYVLSNEFNEKYKNITLPEYIKKHEEEVEKEIHKDIKMARKKINGKYEPASGHIEESVYDKIVKDTLFQKYTPRNRLF